MDIKVPATSANLGAGFDCIGLALNLYNYIQFEKQERYDNLEMDIIGEGEEILPKDKSNLVYRAYTSVFKYLQKPITGIKIKLTNNIPLARGLGSSAAAVIGGLVVANNVLDNPLTADELLKLAVDMEGHPDNVAPALLGGFVISGRNSGDSLFYKKINSPKQLKCSILVPNYTLSTEKAREVLPKNISLQDAVFNLSRMALLIDALYSEKFDLFKTALEDKLHQPYRKNLMPGFEEMLSIANKDKNILGVSLSGAGPSIIFFHTDEKKDLSKMQNILIKHKIDSKVLHLAPTDRGWEYL